MDPDGAPCVATAAVVVGANAQVQEGPDDASPSFTWTNPTSEAAGSLGLASLDESAPLAVEVGQGAGVFDPVRRRCTAARGHRRLRLPGEISRAQVAVVETGTP